MGATAESLTYPDLYAAADEASASGQRRYMALVAVRAVALVLAAVGGAVSWSVGGVEVLAWTALIAFAIALAVEVLMYALVPDQLWYEGRAAAESVKTLSWRYAVGGDPFSHSLHESDVAHRFIDQLAAVTEDLRHIPPPSAGDAGEVTQSMIVARRGTLSERKRLYKHERIVDQLDWYKSKARTNERMRQRFLLFTVLVEFGGVVAASLRVAGAVDFDLLGILVAITSGFATWAQTRRYGELSRSYSIAAHEINAIRVEIDNNTNETWPRFVDESEEAISREHTLWRASRGVLRQRLPR